MMTEKNSMKTWCTENKSITFYCPLETSISICLQILAVPFSVLLNGDHFQLTSCQIDEDVFLVCSCFVSLHIFVAAVVNVDCIGLFITYCSEESREPGGTSDDK